MTNGVSSPDPSKAPYSPRIEDPSKQETTSDSKGHSIIKKTLHLVTKDRTFEMTIVARDQEGIDKLTNKLKALDKALLADMAEKLITKGSKETFKYVPTKNQIVKRNEVGEEKSYTVSKKSVDGSLVENDEISKVGDLTQEGLRAAHRVDKIFHDTEFGKGGPSSPPVNLEGRAKVITLSKDTPKSEDAPKVTITIPADKLTPITRLVHPPPS